jgi:uncharacterized protein YaaQ
VCDNCGIDILVFLYITNEQIDKLTNKLVEHRFFFTRIASTGGFFNYPNTSLIIGIAKDRLDDLRALIKECCSRRTTHIAAQAHLESYPHHGAPVIVEAEVGGAIMQTVAVEHFEQF